VATVFLTVIKGPGTGAMHPVTGPATIGGGTTRRHPHPDEAVSREHASVRVDGQTVVLEDLESSNGTMVNGEEISSACRLAPGGRRHDRRDRPRGADGDVREPADTHDSDGDPSGT